MEREMNDGSTQLFMRERKFEFTGSETTKAGEIRMWSGSETALRDRIHSPPPPLISLSLFISPPLLWALPSWNNCKSHWEKTPKIVHLQAHPWHQLVHGANCSDASSSLSHIWNRFASLITQQSVSRVVLWVFFYSFIFFPFAPWKERVRNVAQTGRPYQRLSRWAWAAGNQR